MESEISLPEEHFPEKLLLKSMTVDTTLKLTQRDWVKEQMDDVDINKIVQLLKSSPIELIYGSRNGFISNPNLAEM